MRKRELAKRLQEHPEWRRAQRAPQPAATLAAAADGGQPARLPTVPASKGPGPGPDDSMDGESGSHADEAVIAQIKSLQATIAKLKADQDFL